MHSASSSLEAFEVAHRDGVRMLLRSRSLDPDAPDLKDTPGRVWRAFQEMTRGYDQDPDSLLSTVFEEECDEMILLKGIRFTSLCEHHLLPFSGQAHVGYIPRRGKVVGLSKLARLVQAYAQRLQLQERLTRQIAEALQHRLRPLGTGCLVEAQHSCMGCRGPVQPDAIMRTSCLTGVLLRDSAARAEFFSLCQ